MAEHADTAGHLTGAEEELDTEEERRPEDGGTTREPKDESSTQHRTNRLVITAGIGIVIALTAAVGWLGFGAYRSHETQSSGDLFIAAGRQAALDLTTIDYTRVDADLARILDSAVGKFRDDFQSRSQPFIDVVKQAQSKSVGTVTEAALESESGEQAQVLVAVSVETSNTAAQEQRPRAWRMRISLQTVGDSVKVSDVQFVT